MQLESSTGLLQNAEADFDVLLCTSIRGVAVSKTCLHACHTKMAVSVDGST